MERRYKDSGIEWIGKIPETWSIERMKGLFIERNERDCKGRTLLSVSQYFGIRPKSETDIADSHIAESYDDYKEVYQGDFVMNIMLAWNGSYAVSEYDGMVSPAYCVFKFRKNCCKKYFHYLLRTNGYPTAFKTMSRGVIDSRLRLYPEQFYTFPVIIPSVDEQQRIVDYLDKKCGEIDSLIALQEQMIEKLKAYKQSVITEAVTKGLDPNAKLVPSGIDWIGEIPEGWHVGKVSHFYNIQLGKMLQPNSSTSADTYEYYYCAANVGQNSLKYDPLKQMWFSPKEKEQYVVKVGDLLVVEGGDVASCDIVKKDLGNVYFQNALHRVRSRNKNDVRILRYLLMAAKELGQIHLICNKATISHFTKDKFENLIIPIPSLSVQRSIASYLDEKCADIDRLIALKQQKIESLKEYKKSVIYEAVTGKTIIES